MEKKQSSVDWLISIVMLSDEEISKARKMHREEAEEIWKTAHQAGRFEGKGIAEKNWQTLEQYYDETFEN